MSFHQTTDCRDFEVEQLRELEAERADPIAAAEVEMGYRVGRTYRHRWTDPRRYPWARVVCLSLRPDAAGAIVILRWADGSIRETGVPRNESYFFEEDSK